MVTITDVLHHIAEDIRAYSGEDKLAAVEEFLSGTAFDFHLAVTTDVEETQNDFINRYGKGHSTFFRLADYEHGKLLAGQMFWILQGQRPDLTQYTGTQFPPGCRLYLFVHLRNVDPLPEGLGFYEQP